MSSAVRTYERHRHQEVQRDCSTLERPSKMRLNKGNSSNRDLNEEPETTKRVEDNRGNHDMNMMFTTEMRDELHGVLLQRAEKMRVSWVEGEQSCQTDIAHDSCPSDDVDLIPTETQNHEGKEVCKTISEAGENSHNISDILEHQVSALQLELHNMKSDHYILSKLSMTWENHLALNLEELTEALSWDQE